MLFRSSSFQVYMEVMNFLCSPLNPVGFRVYAIWGDVFEEPLHSLGIFVCWGRYTGLTLAKWAITITIGLLVGIELPSARCEI